MTATTAKGAQMQYGYEHRRSAFKGGNEASPRTVVEAKLAFCDAIALYGHDSAEALVAERIWKKQCRLVANLQHSSCSYIAR